MFQKISAIAAKIERIVNRTAYVFEVVKWGLATLRIVGDQLRAFPKHEEENSDIPKPDSGSAEGSKEQQPGEPSNIEVAVERKDSAER